MFFSISITAQSTRERISINYDWRFFKGDPTDAKGIFYGVPPKVTDRNDNIIGDTRANQTNTVVSYSGLKKWIPPSANDFIENLSKHHQRPAGNPGGNVSFVQNNFDDSGWEQMDFPHDWAIRGPFYDGDNAVVGGGMGDGSDPFFYYG